jgi:hypothetical protein
MLLFTQETFFAGRQNDRLTKRRGTKKFRLDKKQKLKMTFLSTQIIISLTSMLLPRFGLTGTQGLVLG